jgi:hypothetical protein
MFIPTVSSSIRTTSIPSTFHSHIVPTSDHNLRFQSIKVGVIKVKISKNVKNCRVQMDSTNFYVW